MKIGIIREGKNPPDRRTPFTPSQIIQIQRDYPGKFSFFVQTSPIRCFSDMEYSQVGCEVVEEIDECDVIFGIKEVPIDRLIPGKTFFFFSHTMKKQKYNRALLKAVLDKNIRLIDYEVLKDESGNRIVAFGRWAGIVGTYNALWTYGKKTGLFDIKRAYQCFDKNELESELNLVQLPPIKIIVTGSGRVGKGAVEILEKLGIRKVSSSEFLHQYFDEPVYLVLHSSDYYRRKSDGGFDKEEFYQSPELYESHFMKFAEEGEILISSHYWNPEAPRLFELKDIDNPDFALSVIADISCDVEGSIPTTVKTSNILQPVYDIDRSDGRDIEAFGSQSSISVMAIDNLPCELPRGASKDFGEQLIQWVIPELAKEVSLILEKATIARDGDLTLEFMYLSDFVNGES